MFNGPAKIEHLSLAPDKRILAISDVHANLPYLKGLLQKAAFCENDELFFVGDFLEKGPESLATLRFVMALCRRGNAHAICGNCDDWTRLFAYADEDDAHFRRYLAMWKTGLVRDMCRELGLDPERESFAAVKRAIWAAFPEEWAFLSAIPHALETEHLIFVHAGIHAEKPLEAHTAGELYKYDNYLATAQDLGKWVIVGHWPVMLYHEDIVDANPIIDRERRVVSIDGGCVLKDDGQLNALILPCESSEDFSHIAYDPFPTARVLFDQAASARSYYIRWGDSKLNVLHRGKEFSLCRHVRTGYEMEILTKYLYTDDPVNDCNDSTDYRLPLHRGDIISIVETTSRGYLCKHEGISGWYEGEVEWL